MFAIWSQTDGNLIDWWRPKSINMNLFSFILCPVGSQHEEPVEREFITNNIIIITKHWRSINVVSLNPLLLGNAVNTEVLLLFFHISLILTFHLFVLLLISKGTYGSLSIKLVLKKADMWNAGTTIKLCPHQ